MTKSIHDVLTNTDWAELARHKSALFEIQIELEQITESERKDGDEERLQKLGHWWDSSEGLINWIDALQDAGEAEGYPVRFLHVPEEGDPGYDPEREGRVVLVTPDGTIKEEL